MLFFYLFFYSFFYYVSHTNRPFYQNIISTIFVFSFVWLVAWLISLFIGFVVKRHRPYVKYPTKVHFLFKPLFEQWKSMPSDHAMTCAILIGLISLIATKPMIIIYIVLSLWVMWGRIYAGVHYFSDIIVGVLIGASVYSIWYYLVIYYINRMVIE